MTKKLGQNIEMELTVEGMNETLKVIGSDDTGISYLLGMSMTIR